MRVLEDHAPELVPCLPGRPGHHLLVRLALTDQHQFWLQIGLHCCVFSGKHADVLTHEDISTEIRRYCLLSSICAIFYLK